ncbi:MAG: hypothetical protein ROY99_06665 [Ignavibacterium sp.]|nr:hypothetical protein [Ignavibacterium sp.]
MKKILLICFLSVILISGCLNYNQNTIIYPDGSGEMQINYWMKYSDSSSVSTILNLEIFNPDSIRKEFASDFTTIQNITSYSDSTDSTIRADINIKFNHVDSLNTIKAFAQSKYHLEDGASGQKIFSQFIPPIATGFGIEGSKYHITYSYNIRGEIITHNATNKAGNNLTWSYSLDEIGRGKTISVTFKPYKLKETPRWIYILAGSVLLMVIFFLIKKRKD